MMYHYLVGTEPGLAGRWAFENALGRDSAVYKRHAFPVDKPEFTELSDIDLEPLGSPYLVAQVTLMEDYHFDDDKITPRNSYRLQVTAYDGNDRPLPDLYLSISIQAEPSNPFQSANLLSDDAGKTVAHPIGINQPYVMGTNSRGIITFAIEATELLAPVLRITAPFMLQDHALLVFPDRQAHHLLSQVSEADLLNKKVEMVPGEAPKAMVSAEFQDSATAVAHAIRNFMGVATEKTPQSNAPVVRPVEQRLREIVTPPVRRLYENATASPDAYNAKTDVISGYAVVQGQPNISRSLSVNELPDWSFRKDENGNFVVAGTHRSNRTRNMSLTENLIVTDPLTRLLLGLTNDRQRSDTPPSYTDLLAAIDETNRTRGFFDLFTAISEAVSFVVQTVEHVYEAVKETIRVAVVYIEQVGGAITAFAIHTVQHAVEAVKGVLDKVGATVMGAINFVKALLDWDDILETQQFNEKLLKSVMSSTQANLETTKSDTDKWANNLKDTVKDWLKDLKTNATAHKSAIKSDAAPGERTNVKGSYVQHLVGAHVKEATLEGEVAVGTPDTESQQALDIIHRDHKDKVDGVTSSLADLHLFSGTDFSLDAIVDRLVDLLEEIADKVFDLMIAGIDWFFDQLKKMLTELDKLLAYRIDIPLVTRLYEEVIMKGNGTELTLYSLGALLGAIPATIIYKLATGSDHGPFHGQELARYTNFLDKRNEENGEPVKPTAEDIAWRNASIGMGGTFLAFTGITGIVNNLINFASVPVVPPLPDPLIGLRRIAFPLNFIFQMTQIPLGSIYTLKSDPKDPPAALENTIWAIQFLPLVLEFITVLDKVSAANKPGFDKFSGIAMTVFGGAHAAFFIGVFAAEMTKPSPNQVDSGLKFGGNLASCIPELTVMLPNPYKTIVSSVSYVAWEALSIARYALEIEAGDTVFSPH
ncbi:MAG: hypothetical protein GC137_05620 [Alphaproteobacteria bacterium]|nr:hypothetical protein [Alphaproteobacteria bacterium]